MQLLKRAPLACTAALLCVLFTAAVLYSRAAGLRDWTYTLIAAASVSFVVSALTGGAHKHSYGRCMALGLTGCAAADLIGPYHFVWGSVTFLLSHLAFISAFLLQGIHWRRVRISVVPLLVAGGGLAIWLLPHVPRHELWLVISYMLVISTMVALAFGARVPGGYALLTSGATLFYISDIVVARWQYVAPGSINAWFCYPMYYSACILLALSVASVTMAHEHS